MKNIIKILLSVFLLNTSLLTNSYASENKEKEVVIHIKEMTCQLCAYLVNKELRNIEGVISTKAAIKDNSVKVITEEKVQNETLFEAIKKLKYTPELLSDSSK